MRDQRDGNQSGWTDKRSHCVSQHQILISHYKYSFQATSPSAEAQSKLIRACYERAGLNVLKVQDHPQYFEAHGTGTPTGDPIEAEAISSVFSSNRSDHPTPLFVGSIKTVVGHTEGTAGLAGILKASLAVQNALIPPNLHFQQLNASIAPFYNNLQIPTSAFAWPLVPDAAPRRASVNRYEIHETYFCHLSPCTNPSPSFGFGGANAHAILESYRPPTMREFAPPSAQVFSPYLFSAASLISLSRNLQAFYNFLQCQGASIDMPRLAYTLHSRRTRLPIVQYFSAFTTEELSSKIHHWLSQNISNLSEQQPRTVANGRSPNVICLFTGQGAQWAQMGTQLIAHSESCRSILKKLDCRLARLPVPPPWSLVQELDRDRSSSRVDQAAISQPLCTAIQILLVEVLRSARISFTAAVGHSSGEIAAAYAQGVISAEDAICIAYYRGFHVQASGGNGAMLAAGSSQDDIQELLEEPEFVGRACIAAVNSPNSVTVSGDAEAIHEIQAVLKDEKKFARILKVDQAYHSRHMENCSLGYLQSLESLKIKNPAVFPDTWSSSTYGGAFESLTASLAGPYWDSNLRRPVQFLQAIRHAWERHGPFDLALEIGPHPTLKSPFLEIIRELHGQDIPYTGFLQRNANDLMALADCLGYIAARLGKQSVDFEAFDTFISGTSTESLSLELPSYCWNHDYGYWFESRKTKAVLQRSDNSNMLLGHMCPNSTEEHMSWSNILRPKEIRWLEDHRIQGQIVFPAAGYVIAAVEACLMIVELDSVASIHISDMKFSQALIFSSTEAETEVVTYLADIQRSGNSYVKANFSLNAARNLGHKLETLTSGSIHIQLAENLKTSSLSRGTQAMNLMEVESREFYASLSQLGYRMSFLSKFNLKTSNFQLRRVRRAIHGAN